MEVVSAGNQRLGFKEAYNNQQLPAPLQDVARCDSPTYDWNKYTNPLCYFRESNLAMEAVSADSSNSGIRPYLDQRRYSTIN
eukprot:15361999-Ditylum_brightwellii.AAC.1